MATSIITAQEEERLVSAKEIAAKYNIPYPTVNHYTNLGFFNVVKRRGNRRFFVAKEVEVQLNRILSLIDEGYPLSLIRKKLI